MEVSTGVSTSVQDRLAAYAPAEQCVRALRRAVPLSASADLRIEAVASGLGVTLLAAGNVEIYRRDDVVCRPVTGLSPSELAVVWRTRDSRDVIRVFVDACFQCLCKGVVSAEPAG
jgi:DNA-binding transcriptional LysR family regulator